MLDNVEELEKATAEDERSSLQNALGSLVDLRESCGSKNHEISQLSLLATEQAEQVASALVMAEQRIDEQTKKNCPHRKSELDTINSKMMKLDDISHLKEAIV